MHGDRPALAVAASLWGVAGFLRSGNSTAELPRRQMPFPIAAAFDRSQFTLLEVVRVYGGRAVRRPADRLGRKSR
jgi:hypothetical protein